MKRTFAYGAATVQGDWFVQEDGFFVDPVRGRFALADGFGGKGKGDLAVREALGLAREIKNAGHGPLGSGQHKMFSDIHAKIQAENEKRAPAARGGLSLLLAEISERGEVALSGCGACAALLLRDGKLRALLTPQAPPRAAEGEPLLPQAALGIPGAPLERESRYFSLRGGDLLLLASSGLEWEGEFFASQLAAQIGLRLPGESLSPLAAVLVEPCQNPGRSWNRSLVVVEHFGNWPA